MRGELIRERLHRGERVYGTHVCSLTNPLSAKMQALIPYDFVFVCNEHMPIDRTETAMLCQFYAAHGVSPAVRIPRPQAHWAAMALDAGAQGIVAPYLETVEEAGEMVGAVKYRPIKGRMLREILGGRRRPAPKTIEFLNRFNRNNYLIIGVESVAAYESLDALLALRGVDGVFVGPHDLTVSMEIPEEYGHPEFRRMLKDIVRRSRAAGLGVGIQFSQSVVSDEVFHEFMDEGMNWILYGADVSLLVSQMRTRLAAFRQRMGDTYTTDADTTIQPSSCLSTTIAPEEGEA
jgi:4-hydroxy-2-oxoheptanedioate aldolase